MNNYIKINNKILDDENLYVTEKMLLIYLIRYNNEEKGYSSPSMKTLTKHLGYSHDRYTREKLNSLIEKGYIRRETVKQKNRYYINTINEIINR